MTDASDAVSLPQQVLRHARSILLTHLDIACLYLIVHMLLSWRLGPSQLYVGPFAPAQAAAALH